MTLNESLASGKTPSKKIKPGQMIEDEEVDSDKENQG